MKPSDYQRYLASREWAVLKQQVRERSGGTCERCKRRPHTSTHHLTYERIGQEKLEDLQGVCELCHEWLSGKRGYDPAWFVAFGDREEIKGGICASCSATPEIGTVPIWMGLLTVWLCDDCLLKLLMWASGMAEQIATTGTVDGSK